MALEKRRPRIRRELTPYSPFRDLEEMDRRFEDLLGRPFLPSRWPEEKELMPPIEITEKEDSYVIKAEIPGMKKEDIDISVSDNTLTIRGEKKSEKEERKEGYYYSEWSYGSFARSITLPSSVDTSKIEASQQDGVLEISLPKSAEVKPKKIQISAKNAKNK